MVRVEVLSAKLSASKPDRGVVTTRQEVCNQDGTVVLTYNVSRMLKRAAPGQSRL
jgi:acyl dehydratase